MPYASETTVPVERSRAEIEETLRRYGASEFHSGWAQDRAVVMFRVKNLFVRFILTFPDRGDKRFTHVKDRYGIVRKKTEPQALKAYDQELRRRWRALLLVVKAKLEAVESGISSLEQEFLAFIVMPDDRSVMDWMATDVLPLVAAGQMPQLALPAPKEPDR